MPNYNFNKLKRSRHYTEVLFIFLLQLVGLKASTLLPAPSSIWIASGTSTAFLFMRGITILPGIALGSFAAALLSHFSLSYSIIFSLVFTIQPLILLKLMYHFADPTLFFISTKRFFRFLLLCCIVSLLAVITLWITDHSSQKSIFILFINWLANLNGTLIIGCGIVAWDLFFPDFHALEKKKLRLPILFYSLIGIISVYIFFQKDLTNILEDYLILGLIMVLCAQLYGWCGALLASAIPSLVYSFLLYLGTPIEHGFLLIHQVCIGYITILNLFLTLGEDNAN